MNDVRVSDEPMPPQVTVSSGSPVAGSQHPAARPDATETAAFEIIPEEPEVPVEPLPPFFTYRLLCVIVLIGTASFPLFYASVWTSNFIRYINRRSSNPVFASQTIMERATSDVGRAQIRPAIAPFALFVLLECGAAFVVASMFRRKEGLPAVRRITKAAFISLWITALLQVPFWVLFSNPRR